jgi:hypothetical protein
MCKEEMLKLIAQDDLKFPEQILQEAGTQER